MRTADYSTFINRAAALIGVAASDLQTEERAILNTFFNHAISSAWESSNWLDLTHIGEARFAGNLVPYANAYTANGSSWSVSSVTVTDNVYQNPADARVTAASMIEDSSNSVHQIQSPLIQVLPATDYVFSAYIAPAGRSYVRLRVAIGASLYFAFFNLTGAGSVVSETSATGGIGQVANGFYKCTLSLMTDATNPQTAAVSVALSTDGSTTSYTGDGVSGVWMWGYVMSQTNAPAGSLVIDWTQTGETEIEALFQIWKNPPSATNYPTAFPYYLTPNGAQLIGPGTAWNTGTPNTTSGTSQGNPVYVDFREPVPKYEGSDYSVSSTYTYGEQVYFTTSSDVGNYYSCVAVTTAGQSPATHPAKWAVIPVPRVFLDYTVYNSYAQWLRVEGRTGAAEIMENRSVEELNQEFDRQERQMGAILPTKYQTHVSAQPR